MAILTLSGVAYTKTTGGGNRPVLALGQNLGDLTYAADVTAPSSARHLRWVGASKSFAAGDTTAVVVGDTPSYQMLVLAKAHAKTQFIRGIRGAGNTEIYHVFMHPMGLAKLKLDPDFLANVRSAGARGATNPVFSGSVVTVDGLVIHEFRHVYNTLGVAGPNKWGAAGTVDGQRVLFCGAQALAFADLGAPNWEEEDYDYGNAYGIAIDKIAGFLKPKFYSPVTGNAQDFGVLVIDTAI